MRKISRKGLVKKLDHVVSQIVIARDKKCVICGSTEKLGCGHLFSRVAFSTRWDLDNCYASCWPCNFRHEYDPYPMMEAVKHFKLFDVNIEALHRKYVTPHKYTTPQLEELYNELSKPI
jgi:5-methylcytosine-specific restriction endonuclease McrA